jgi:ubiquitin carboxyl-terminal hydrolase 7
MERMEEKMKGTEAENVLSKLFCGKVRTYISCINVEYESRRVEDFWDIQLNVSGNKNLEESFKDYVQVEVMNGENQYFAGEQFKLQDANKGVIFETFPEVLHLQLKRFQYDIDRDAMMKINDRYEFPETFDAAPYLSDDADKSESWIYQLHGVLVHSGDLNAGHYYAFIKPTKDGWFYKYDDDKVTKATMREVLEENFGGEYLLPNGSVAMRGKTKPIIRQMSAYMLVYIRQSRLDEVLLPVTKEDTPPHLQKKLDEEAALREMRRKEREEQHLYLGCKVITEDTYRAHGATDLTSFERVHSEDEPAAPRFYRLLRKSTVEELMAKVGADTNVDPKRIRLWAMVNRQNKTIRPDAPVADINATVEDTYQRLGGSKTAELRLWAEVAEDVNSDGDAIWPATPSQTNGNVPKTDLIVLFLKWFDLESQSLSGAGHIYISREKKVEDLVPVILKKMGWTEKTQLRLFEVRNIKLCWGRFANNTTGDQAKYDRANESQAVSQSC